MTNHGAGAANPALEPLDFLVGTWTIELSNAAFLATSEPRVMGEVSVTWLEHGALLSMRQFDRQGPAPAATWVFGRDQDSDAYRVFYYDRRMVSRIYEMSFGGRTWRMWRDNAAFSQRFRGEVSIDQRVITATWEKSEAGGRWEHDFDVVYTKLP